MDDKDKISDELNELKRLAPNLFGIKKEGDGFEIPRGYFDSMLDEIEAKQAIEESVLSKIPKENSFEVPANYFEDMAYKLQNAIAEESSRVPVWQTWLQIVFRPRLVLAYASILVVLMGSFFFFNNQVPENKVAEVAGTTAIVAPVSLEDQLVAELDEALLAEALIDEEVETASPKSEKQKTDEKAVDYLMDNDIDVNTIINEIDLE